MAVFAFRTTASVNSRAFSGGVDPNIGAAAALSLLSVLFVGVIAPVAVAAGFLASGALVRPARLSGGSRQARTLLLCVGAVLAAASGCAVGFLFTGL